MKAFKWAILIVGLLVLLIFALAAPIALIGVVFYIAGMWLFAQEQKGKHYREKPWMGFTLGFIVTLVLALIFVEDVPEEPAEKGKTVEVEKKDQE
ncbi:hypothetical protein [Mesobacillus subterraneus]|uniref:Uncharacterized protein n=1 Tax=Mesobacillus subterraneus TaxID=285983 RepID=A0A3R9FI04_9BACI|nr:hypothetical protein [Mesobacillus subterraneus]RSD26865.1 hypothetical protein EJA10_13535 [Mesobacillus subterraneus]